MEGMACHDSAVLLHRFDADTEAAMRQRAIDNGILEKARENAERIIEKLLTANPAVKENYTIVFIQS